MSVVGSTKPVLWRIERFLAQKVDVLAHDSSTREPPPSVRGVVSVDEAGAPSVCASPGRVRSSSKPHEDSPLSAVEA